jgi:hypothetical protein
MAHERAPASFRAPFFHAALRRFAWCFSLAALHQVLLASALFSWYSSQIAFHEKAWIVIASQNNVCPSGRKFALVA